MTNTNILTFLTLSIFVLSPLSFAGIQKIEIELSDAIFVLPNFEGPYRRREASIAPSEYEMAEEIRMLLDNDNKKEVLASLGKFYDIELSPAMQTLKAQVYFSLKDYDQAERHYLNVLKRMPELVRVHSDLGRLYLIKNDYAKARKYFANAIGFGENSAGIHGQLAYINLEMYGAFSAISGYQQALALDPTNKQWRQGLLVALIQAKMYEAASALIREQLNLDPGDIDLWLNQASLALQQDNSTLALNSLEMAILLGDKKPKNLTAAAQLHMQHHSYDRAVDLLEKNLTTSKLDMSVLSQYLSWMEQAKMWCKAKKLLSNAETKVSTLSRQDQSIYYYHAARISENSKNISKAELSFDKSIELNPLNGKALIAYAKHNKENKNHTKSELLYIRAEAISEYEKPAMLGRIQLYLEMQDYQSALTHLINAVTKYPDLIHLKNNIDVVENIIRTKKQTNK
ncbi:MAG: tetratricopeptide (TPR) repeat protein [Flavobacteriales bacterium]|jgi:tetratricopeptide (TPR) repeat protein